MPGVVVTTAVRTGPAGANIAPASTFFVCGTAERGSIVEAKLVTSVADFEELYGAYNGSYTLHQHVRTFFEEGGTKCYAARVVGASTSVGSIQLNAAGPTPALQLDASSPGSWSSDVSVAIVAGTGANFILKLYFQDTLIYSSGNVATAAAVTDKINNSTVASNYVTATALVGGSALLVAAAANLSAGDDGAAPSTGNLITGLDLFTQDLGAGAVAIPGQYSTTYYDAVLAHCLANNRIGLLGMDPSFTDADAITAAADYATVEGAEYIAFYHPYLEVPVEGNVTIEISPESFVAAKRSVAHQTVGPWQAPAGLLSKAKYVTGTTASIDRTASDTLNEGRVNPIRVIQGSVRIYGARSASDDEENYRYITYRDFLNYIVVEAENTLEDLVFSTIDGRRTVFGRTEARLIGLLEPLRTSGGLYEAFDSDGRQIDPGYSVAVTDALNPVSQLAAGTVKGRIGVRISSVADLILIEVVKSNLTASVV
jgi:hypothetical protein